MGEAHETNNKVCKNEMLTGIKNVDYLICTYLTDEDLRSLCLTCKYCRRLLNSSSYFGEEKIKIQNTYNYKEIFWRNRFITSFLPYLLNIEIQNFQKEENIEKIKEEQKREILGNIKSCYASWEHMYKSISGMVFSRTPYWSYYLAMEAHQDYIIILLEKLRGINKLIKVREFHPNGLIKRIYFYYRDPLPNFSEFSLNDLQKERIGRIYIKDVMEGKLVEWYDNETVSSVNYFKGEERHGNWLSWYQDQKPKYSFNYVNGKLVGEIKEWYPNGQLCYVKNYNKDGLQHGESIYYNPDGSIFKVEEFYKGLPHGKFISFPSFSSKLVSYFYKGKEVSKSRFYLNKLLKK